MTTELKWTRTAPGHYETKGSFNGYAYRIYCHRPGWPYTLEYRWDNDSTGTWKRPLQYSHGTVTRAKRRAVGHNANPRQKWVFVGREEDGSLAFQPADEREDSTFKTRYYLGADELASS
jgi:hypothetical protein